MAKPKKHHIYTTPAGYTCNCGTAQGAMDVGSAKRLALLHGTVNHKIFTIHSMQKEEST